jgi:DNA helicase IV
VRSEGEPPAWHLATPSDLAQMAAKVVISVKHRHRLTGVVAPPALHESLSEALSEVGLAAVDHVHELGHDDVPLFGPETVKGLEFDGVVVVNPHEILDGTTRGARLLYVAMTRAVQELAFVSSAPAPTVIA